MTLQPSLFDGPETPHLQQVSPAHVRSLAGVLLGFTRPGLTSSSIKPADRAHAEQVAAEALAKLQAD